MRPHAAVGRSAPFDKNSSGHCRGRLDEVSYYPLSIDLASRPQPNTGTTLSCNGRCNWGPRRAGGLRRYRQLIRARRSTYACTVRTSAETAFTQSRPSRELDCLTCPPHRLECRSRCRSSFRRPHLGRTTSPTMSSSAPRPGNPVLFSAWPSGSVRSATSCQSGSCIREGEDSGEDEGCAGGEVRWKMGGH